MKKNVFLSYGLLAIVTFLIALMLLHVIPEVYIATQSIWPNDQDLLPMGLVLVEQYRFLFLLIPIGFGCLGLFAFNARILATPIAVAICACVAILVLTLGILMLCTPIIAHGGLVGRSV